MTNEQIERLEQDMIDAIDTDNFAKAKAISEILERERKSRHDNDELELKREIEQKKLDMEIEKGKENTKLEIKKAFIMGLCNFAGLVFGKGLHFMELNKVLAYESTGSLSTYSAKSIALKGGN